MKLRPSTVLLFTFVILLNLGVSLYISQTLSMRTSLSNEDSIAELGAEVESLTAWVKHLTRFVESKHGGTIVPDAEVGASLREELFAQKEVHIGLISATTRGYEDYTRYVREIIEPDLNALSWELGSDLRFVFDIFDAKGQAAVHLEHVAELDAKGVNMVIGGMWSSQACASLSYSNDNGILLFSPSSTSPLKAIENDNLFRLCPTDFKIAPVMVNLIQSKGVEAVVVIQRGDSWADGICNSFVDEFTQKGGVIIQKFRYPAESSEFSKYLEAAETAALEAVEKNGWDKVGGQLLSFNEAVNIVRDLPDYPTLFNLTWFGSDGNVQMQQMIDEAPSEAGQVKLYSMRSVLPDTDEVRELSILYEGLTGTPLDYYDACSYDIAMIMGRAIIEASTVDTDTVKAQIQELCTTYQGVTGLCRLDAADDRESSNYGIFSYSEKDGELGCWQVGWYSDTGELNWYED